MMRFIAATQNHSSFSVLVARADCDGRAVVLVLVGILLLPLGPFGLMKVGPLELGLAAGVEPGGGMTSGNARRLSTMKSGSVRMRYFLRWAPDSTATVRTPAFLPSRISACIQMESTTKEAGAR